MEYILILIAAVFVNNIVLSQFLGICPFLGVSNKVSTSIGMSGAVLFVMTIATTVTYLLHEYILVPTGLNYLRTITFILVIAALVQMVEIILKKVSPPLYQALGVFLPLITTNCAILGVSESNISNIWTESLPYGQGLALAVFTALGTSLGFGLIIFAFSSIREKLESSNVPEAWKGVPISLVVAGIMSMAFFGLAGII